MSAATAPMSDPPPEAAAVDPYDVYVPPSFLWSIPLRGGIGMTFVLASSEKAYAAVSEKVPLPSRRALQVLAVGTAAVHVGEAIYTHRLATANGMPRSARRYAFGALTLGFPAILSLRAQIAARS